MKELFQQLATFAPALIAQMKGNPVALQEFTRGYQETLAQQQEQRMRQQQMTMQGEDRQRMITRQGEQDRIAGEERDYGKYQDALKALSEFVPMQETMGGAESMTQSVMAGVPPSVREMVAPMADAQLRQVPQMITGRQKKAVEAYVEAAMKTAYVADNPDSDPELAQLPEHIAKILGKPSAKLSELQQFAQLPVGKPQGKTRIPAAAGSFEDYVAKKYGEAPTPEQIIEARKVYNQADDRAPRVTVNTGAEGAFPPAVQRRIDAKVRGFESNPIVKKTAVMAEAVSFSDALDPNTTNPADDQALIYAFAKAMDPESVVREGEYATVQKYAQSWSDQFGFDVKRIFSNTPFLTPQARQQLKATIRTKYGAARGQFENIRSEYGRQIERITRMPGGVEELPDFGAAFPSVEAQAGGKPKRGANPFRPQ